LSVPFNFMKELEKLGKVLDSLSIKHYPTKHPLKLNEFVAVTPELREMQIERGYIPPDAPELTIRQKEYNQKLLDPRWKIKRDYIRQRDNFTCTKCGDRSKRQHVHHKKYEGDPWNCPNELLTTLCEDCHAKISNRSSNG
jgi:hypothetical protein